MTKKRCHVWNRKVVNVGQKIGKMHFLWHLTPAYPITINMKVNILSTVFRSVSGNISDNAGMSYAQHGSSYRTDILSLQGNRSKAPPGRFVLIISSWELCPYMMCIINLAITKSLYDWHTHRYKWSRLCLGKIWIRNTREHNVSISAGIW